LLGNPAGNSGATSDTRWYGPRPIIDDDSAKSRGEYDPELYRIRHSTAHVVAQAIVERFVNEGRVCLAGGPPIADGFYYDFLLPRSLTDEDLKWIEDRTKQILAGNHTFTREVLNPEAAREMFSDQPFKLETVDGLLAGDIGDIDDNGNRIENASDVEISIRFWSSLWVHPMVDAVNRQIPQQIGVHGCSGAGLLVLGFGARLSRSITRMSRCTRLRLTSTPSAFDVRVIIRLPKNG
jgi:hypothetical protein